MLLVAGGAGHAALGLRLHAKAVEGDLGAAVGAQPVVALAQAHEGAADGA
jgi:hypothetical protein